MEELMGYLMSTNCILSILLLSWEFWEFFYGIDNN